MPHSTSTRTPRFVQTASAGGDDIDRSRREATQALLAEPARIAPKFFYDRLGSHLFEAITELSEYYPTRTEGEIFARHGAEIAAEIAAAVGTGMTLIDLGAGNCAKAAKLFALFEPARYVAVDISVEFLRDALRHLQRENPQLDLVGVGQDFSSSLDLDDDVFGSGARVFFYPGSSIGNFTPSQASAFLGRIAERARGGRDAARIGGVLVGVDLVKDRATLEAAYDDALGVTAAFNRNALRTVDRLVGTDFDPRQWRHVALFNEAASRIEMHLEARVDLLVAWPGGSRRFTAGERIHTENSYKYRIDGFATMLRDAGFASPRVWTDANERFAVFWAATPAQ